MPKLVQLNTCYFDEIDVNCFAVLTDEAFIKWADKLENWKSNLVWYFDSFTPVEWDSGKDFYEECTISFLTEQEALVLGKMFPSYNDASGVIANFGTHCSIFNNILD